jgi:MerR family mercuric resistance operon transcriptional regulator
MSAIRIGQVAKHAGVTVETIRFYESQALIPEPPRSESGYRQYTSETIQRVRFIQRAKELGFSLKDIHALLTLRNKPSTTCAGVKAQALKKITEVDEKMLDLTRIRRALTDLVDQCDAEADLSECPILDALDDKDDRVNDER